MTIRTARPEDADQIAAFWNPLIEQTTITFTTEPKSPVAIAADIAAKADTGLPYLALEISGRVVGFATYAQFRGGPGYRHTMEHSIILAPEVRSAGYGRALMQAVAAHARQNKVHSLMAGISGENTQAVAFHKKCGFETVGTVPQAGWKFGRWINLILMQKLIGSH